MFKTASFTLSAKKKGLLALLVIVLFTNANREAVAMTVGNDDTDLQVLSLDENGLAVMQGPEKPKGVKETLLDVCNARGYGEECAKHLLGMAWKESNFKADAKGDYDRNGFPRARGWFQIHYRLHGITATCAEDLTCSANWTIDYLESNSYQKYPRYAIQCHNGCNIDNGYAASVLRHGNRLWNTEGVLVAAK